MTTRAVGAAFVISLAVIVRFTRVGTRRVQGYGAQKLRASSWLGADGNTPGLGAWRLLADDRRVYTHFTAGTHLVPAAVDGCPALTHSTSAAWTAETVWPTVPVLPTLVFTPDIQKRWRWRAWVQKAFLW